MSFASIARDIVCLTEAGTPFFLGALSLFELSKMPFSAIALLNDVFLAICTIGGFARPPAHSLFHFAQEFLPTHPTHLLAVKAPFPSWRSTSVWWGGGGTFYLPLGV